MKRISRPKISQSIIDTVGNTPLVELTKISKNLPGRVVAKLESFNPMSSVKCRIGASMIEAAEKDGSLKSGMTIVEPTSGNTGIGLAYVAAAKGYPITLIMPDTMSVERRNILISFGAELILTPGAEGMPGAIKKAEEIASSDSKYFICQQFQNQANVEAHKSGTAVEIWEDTDGKVDVLVSGIGTGGTITGTATVLKELKPSFKAVAVEPEASPVLSGGKPGPHKIQGIGAGFIPDILNTNLIDEIVQVSNEESGDAARELAKKEGIFAGISSGAALAAAIKIASKPENKDKLIVVILPDTGERYLSTWLWES